MARLESRRATVTALTRVSEASVWGRAHVSGESAERTFLAYPTLTGSIAVGDVITLNTTATAMSLGTGGVDFVMASTRAPQPGDSGHIIKLRYTPLQHAVSVAELEAGWDDQESLAGATVVACLLHSQIAPVAAAIKAKTPKARVAYLMTDSAALPLAFSRLVEQLKETQLVDVTLTCGQAFGGEVECVTLPSALITAAALADTIIVAPGPGNAGTGTRYGFSGIEQAWVLQATTALGGKAVCCLRASAADTRQRHQGLSHHSQTVLKLSGVCPFVGWPSDEPIPGGLSALADVVLADPTPGLMFLSERGVRVTSMGRTVEQDPLFFKVAAASGCI